MYKYANDFVNHLKNCKQIVIYGARTVAYEVANCLMGEPYKLHIDCFLVSDMKGNPKEVLGIPVRDIANGKQYKDAIVLVAVMEKFLEDILENLNNNGFSNVIPCTFESDLWSLLRGNFYQALCEKEGKIYWTLEEALQTNNERFAAACSKTVSIYTAKCHVDRVLTEDTSRYFWEKDIQVGADLTEKRVCAICDNTGENISCKNKEYCELTALYWIWKNDTSDYAGLGHYRRHFELNEELIHKLAQSDVDVILTIPILNFPSVGYLYKQDHIAKDWEIMMEAIKELQPEYSETANRLQDGIFYYAYNMIIAKKNILDDYCKWLFPILEYCEEHCEKKDDKYQNRYLGFLAERLLSIYFLKHENEYKIVHANKHFIER